MKKKLKNIQTFEEHTNENLNISNNNIIDEIINDKTKDSNGYFWGVFGDTLNFFIADKNFNIVFETPAFLKGDWTDEVKDAMKKFGIDDIKSRMRTDDNIEDLKKSIEIEYKISKMYNDRTK